LWGSLAKGREALGEMLVVFLVEPQLYG
jgi:hypothetical protein